MYSKKINQLATNLNPQSTDLIPIGDATTGQLKSTTYGTLSGITGDTIISGGVVTWISGLTFNISPCIYYINGFRYSSPDTTLTLDASDATYDRIDVFAVNVNNAAIFIKGTAELNPQEPQTDPATQLKLTTVIINALATTPAGVTNNMIYDENVESWTKAANSLTVDYANTTSPYIGTYCILATTTAAATFKGLTFSKISIYTNKADYDIVSFAIKLTQSLQNSESIKLIFTNSSLLPNIKVAEYSITKSNSLGFSFSNTSNYQIVSIPISNILFSNNAFDSVQIQFVTTRTGISFRVDRFLLQYGVPQPAEPTTSNSFGFVNGTTGTASSTQATDTLNVVGTGLATTSATGKTLTISVPAPTITFSGDISGSGTTAITTTIGANKVTNAMLAQIATSSFLGRVTASTGNVETLTGTQATTLLDVFTSSLKGLVPASGGGTTNFLRADGTWAAAGGGTTIYTGDGTLTGDRTVTNSTYLLKFVGGKEFLLNEETALRLETSTTGKSALILSLNNTFTTTGKNWLIRSLGTGNLDIRNITNSITPLTISATGETTFIANIKCLGQTTIGLIGTQPGIWFNKATPSGSNYSLYAEATATYINGAGGGIWFRNNNANQGVYTSTGRLIIGSTTEDASAIMKLDSTASGFLPPRMTTTQKNSIGTPAAGLVVYDTTLNKLCVRTASAWETITSV